MSHAIDQDDQEAARRMSTASSVPEGFSKTTVREAAQAVENERNLGIRKSFKLYRKACLWSIFLSTCIVMEGFDVTLIYSLYGFPAFQEQFGVHQPDGTYQLTAQWQSGLSNGALAGSILGLFLNGIIADRFGYRKTIIGALAACVAFIFIIFFSRNLVQLLIGQILIGFPWQALTYPIL